MGRIDLELFKQHVRADDFSEDDALLRHYLESAESAVLASLNRTAGELEALGGGSYPPQMVTAVLLLAGHWYNQREAVGAAQNVEVPYTMQYILKPLQRLI